MQLANSRDAGSHFRLLAARRSSMVCFFTCPRDERPPSLGEDHPAAWAALFLLPTLLRSGVGDWILKAIAESIPVSKARVFQKLGDEEAPASGEPPAEEQEITMQALSCRPDSAAVAGAGGFSAGGARGWLQDERKLFLAASRLFVYHWMQPTLYLGAVYTYWDRIHGFQMVVVPLAAREGYSLAASSACAVLQPAALLLDVNSPREASLAYRALYTLCPEKLTMGWIGAALGGGCGCLYRTSCCGGRHWALEAAATFLARACLGVSTVMYEDHRPATC